MSSSLVVTRREDAVLYVGLNRPEKRNAIHREMLLASSTRWPPPSATGMYGP